MLTESHVSDRFLGLSSLLQRIRAGTVHAMLLAKPLDANYLEGKIIPMPLGRERCHYLDSSVKNIRSAFVAVQPEHIATKLFVGYWMVCAPWGLQSWRLGPSLLALPWLHSKRDVFLQSFTNLTGGPTCTPQVPASQGF